MKFKSEIKRHIAIKCKELCNIECALKFMVIVQCLPISIVDRGRKFWNSQMSLREEKCGHNIGGHGKRENSKIVRKRQVNIQVA